jgi:ElaB/YqjD/DUF883 family membrane-anchored ribosome-binding protein
MTGSFSDTTREATSEAKEAVDSAAERAQGIADKTIRGASEARGSFNDVSGNFRGAIDQSLTSQPYATLGMVIAVGFIVGAIWKS